MTRPFPLWLFPPGAFQLYPAATRITGGAALAGPPQTVDWSAGGWWIGTMEAVRLSRPEQFRAWRSLMMHVGSGGNVVMPIIDDPQRPMDDPSLGPATARFNDGARFSDGSVFLSTTIDFELAEPAAEGDTMLKIRRKIGRPLLGGEYWSFDHPEAGHRAYCIEDLDEENGDQVREVLFGVPLRTDLEAGAVADFETPRVTMDVVSDPGEAWPKIRPPFRADVSARFMESFDYL